MKNILLMFLLVMGGTVAASAQCDKTSVWGYHVVQPKENLYRISMKYGVSLEEISRWNGISINEVLPECAMVRIKPPSARPHQPPAAQSATSPTPDPYGHADADLVPKSGNTNTSNASMENASHYTQSGVLYKKQGKRHTVRPGEKLAGLAELYGFTERKFRELNAMSPSQEVTAGSILLTTDCSCAVLNSTDTYITTSASHSSSSTHTGGYHTAQKHPPIIRQSAVKHRPNLTPKSNPAAGYLQMGEQGMVDEINKLRQNPSSYVPYLLQYKEERHRRNYPIDQVIMDELVGELRSTPPLSKLELSSCMYDAAKHHGADIRRTGHVAHLGSDNSQPWERVYGFCPSYQDGKENLIAGPAKIREAIMLQLLDEATPNREHRRNLLNPYWTRIAAHKVGQVQSTPNVWVLLFGQPKPMGKPVKRTPAVRPANTKVPPKDVGTNHPANQTSYMKPTEQAMLDEINLMRSNPSGYVEYVEGYRKKLISERGKAPDAEIDELVKELKKTKPLSTLQPDRCLHKVARKHGNEMRRAGRSSHKGADGSWPWDRVRNGCSAFEDGNENLVGGPDNVRDAVMLLLIDEGITSRGHRRTLLEPKWTHCAPYSIGTIGKIPNYWVQQFAQKK